MSAGPQNRELDGAGCEPVVGQYTRLPTRVGSKQLQELRRAIEGLAFRPRDADAGTQQSPGQRFLSRGQTYGPKRSCLWCLADLHCGEESAMTRAL